MTLRGSAVTEGVTASIVVTFIYPGSPCDSALWCRAQMSKGKSPSENTESHINVITKP